MPDPAKRLVRDLTRPVREPEYPDGIRVVPFDKSHARAAHAVLVDAYRHGGGEVADFARWWSGLTGDSEYDPTAMLVAIDDKGTVVAIAHCWSSGFLKDIAVARAWRSKGIGRAMVLRAMRLFRLRGMKEFSLKVRHDNMRAESLYRELGMIDCVDS